MYAKKTSPDTIDAKPSFSRFQTPKGVKRDKKRAKPEKKPKKIEKNEKKT
jgi:hypothetical protein